MGLKIRLHFESFFQVDPQMTRVLYAKALEFADLKKTDRVIELYSGTGTIGLLAAREDQRRHWSGNCPGSCGKRTGKPAAQRHRKRPLCL